MSSTTPTSDPTKLCPICGASNAKMYYNGLSCIACKSFFVRAATHLYPYECVRGGNCLIIPNEAKNCKGCRYRRCRQAGMDPDLVHQIRKTDEAVLPLINKYELVRQHVVPVLSLGFHFVAQATYYRGARQFARHYMNIDRISVNNVAQDPRLSYFNLNVSLPDVLLNSSLCFTREEIIPNSPEELLQAIIPHSFCKFLVAFIDFASAVPELRFLPTPDIMKLVQNNRMSVVVLRSYFLHHLEPFRLERQATNVQMVEIISPGHAAQMKRITDFFEQHAAPLFDEIKITEEEMTLLRLIAVVSPVASCSEEGNDILRKARGKYTNILIGYHDEVFVGITALQKVRRLGLLLEFLTKLRVLCEELNQRTTLLVVNNVCNMLGPLSYDVQVRDF